MSEKEEIREMMFEKAEKFARQYEWHDQVNRENFITTLVIQGETIQAIKERWGIHHHPEIRDNQSYREAVDTINAHYMAILTDLLSTASPVSGVSD